MAIEGRQGGQGKKNEETIGSGASASAASVEAWRHEGLCPAGFPADAREEQ